MSEDIEKQIFILHEAFKIVENKLWESYNQIQDLEKRVTSLEKSTRGFHTTSEIILLKVKEVKELLKGKK